MERLDTPAGTIREAVAVFDDPEALKAAISDLQSDGFNRAEISLMARDDLEQHVLPEKGDVRKAEDNATVKRAPVIDDTDIRQRRTLDISSAATVAGFAAAGFTVMTGGAVALAAALGAAAAAGIGGLGAFLGKVYGDEHRKYLEEQLEHGGIVVWVRLRDADSEPRALEVLRRHGGQDVHVHEVPATVPAKEI